MGPRVHVEDLVTGGAARVRELMAQAAELADGLKQKTALLDEAVREADGANLVEDAWDARMKLLQAANWSGDVDKMLVAFAWCVGKYEESPGKFSSRQILWYSKWAALEAPRFPSVSRARIAQLLDDTEARFRAHNASLRPVFQQRHYAAVELGDLDHAARAYDRWWLEPRDLYADCAACEQSARLDWCLTRGDDEGAVDVAASMFASRMRCAEVPHRIYGLTLVPLLKLGRIEESLAAHRAGIRMLAKLEHNMCSDVSHHAVFLALTGNHAAAHRVLNRVLAKAAEHRLPSTKAAVFADAALVCAQLAKSKARAKLTPVAGLDVKPDARGLFDVAAFGLAAESAAAKIAKLYDARNGNVSYSSGLAKKRDLVKYAVDAPLTPR